MFVRNRRAAAPVSNSASTTIRPLTMCSPPANRSIEATSALRQHVFVIWVLASSAFTCAVIAMGPILSRESITVRQDPGVRRRQLGGIMPRGAVVTGDVGDHELGARRLHQVVEVGEAVADASRVGQH